MEVIGKEEAKSKGLLYYCTGKPCKRGNVGPRLVSSGACKCDSCKEYEESYKAKWAQANKDKVNKAANEYYYRNRKERITNQKRLNALNPHWSEKARQKILDKDPDHYKKYYKKYYALNKDNYYKNCVLYRRRSRQATPPWEDGSGFRELVDLARELRDATGFDWDIDHCVPLKAKKASGLNCVANLQVIPASMNRKKGNKMIYSEPYSWLEDFNAVLYCPVMESKSRDGKQFYTN